MAESTGLTHLAGAVIRILVPDGTLVVEVADPQVKITVEGDGGLVIAGAGAQEVRLRPGSYRLLASRDGRPLKDEVIRITRGDTRVVTVSLEPGAGVRSAMPLRFTAPPPGALDRLGPASIPAAERFAWQPKELVAILGDHRGKPLSLVRCVAPSPDGKWIASTDWDDPLVYLWHADTLHLRATLTGHTAGVWSAAFSHDSRRMLTGGDDGTVRLWDVPALTELRRLTGHTGPVWSVALPRAGLQAISGGEDRIIRLWDVEKGQEVRRFEGHAACVYSVTFTPDGLRAVSGGEDGTMRLWEVRTGKEVRKFDGHESNFRFIACLPDGRRALSCSRDRTLRLWDLEGGQVIRCYAGHAGEVFSCAVSFDGRRALSGGGDGTVRLWDVESGQQLHCLRAGQLVNTVAFAPGCKLGLSGGPDGLHQWDLERGVEQKLFERPVRVHGHDFVSRVVFLPDCRRLLTCTRGEDCARLWDVKSGQQLRRFRMPPDIWDLALSSDGRQVFASGGNGVGIWAVETGEEVRHVQTTSGTWGMALSSDDRWLVTAGMDGRAHLWDVASGREMNDFKGHERGAALGVAVSPDGRRLLSGGEDHTVRFWGLDSGAQLQRLEASNRAWGVAFSPTGRQAASSDDVGFVRLYDVTETEMRLRRLPRWHSRAVRSLAFAPDGAALASAGLDGRLILWDVARQAPLREWRLPGPLQAVGFAPDARHLAITNYNGTVYILRLARP
jgi:WD40 repeat protein